MSRPQNVARSFVVALLCVVTLTTAVVPVVGVAQAEQPQTDSTDEANQPEQDSGLPLSLGVGLFFFGAGQYYYARPLADLSEQMDAIGSTTPHDEVEAAAWKFRLTQIAGVLFWLFGVSIIVRSLL